MKNALIIFSIMLWANVFSQRLNRYNHHGERKGKWIVYNDSAKKSKSTVVRYRNGNPIGRAYYYTSEGILGRREIVRFNKIKTTFYNINGSVSMRGNSKMEILTDKVHYYFYGKWKCYDASGKLIKYQYYAKGGLVKTEYVDAAYKAGDSLMRMLANLERNFKEKNRQLISKIDLCKLDPAKCESYRKELMKQDSISFMEVENYLNEFGYPDKSLGESANVPFFIICYANSRLKEKYLPLFRKAIVNGSLSSPTLAFYIDKLELAKGEKQIYGTQGYIDKNLNMVYYPSVDPENLNSRRIEMGLDEKKTEVSTSELIKQVLKNE